ncbi:hypothetical protein LNP25_23730 [Klebsiella variicola subsp. variicola]|nr:hypothetical protein [Klebsiella variicola subsp. variicola]
MESVRAVPGVRRSLRSCPELATLLPGSTVNFDFAHQRLVMALPRR